MTAVDSIELVSERYQQELGDVRNWFHSTEWCTNDNVSPKILENVIYTLVKSGIIEKKISPESLCKKLY